MSMTLEVSNHTVLLASFLMWVGWYTQLDVKAVPPLLAVIMVPLALVYACATGRLDDWLAWGLSHVNCAVPGAEGALEEAKKRLAKAENVHTAAQAATKKANKERESWSERLKPARQTRNGVAPTKDELAVIELGIKSASGSHKDCLTDEEGAGKAVKEREREVETAQNAMHEAERGETVKKLHFALYVTCLVSMVLGSGYILGFSPQIVAAEFDFLKCFPGPEFKECMRSAECRQSNLTDADCTIAKQRLPQNISDPICNDRTGHRVLYEWSRGVVCRQDESTWVAQQWYAWKFCRPGPVSCVSNCVRAALSRCEQSRLTLSAPLESLTTFGLVLVVGLVVAIWSYREQFRENARRHETSLMSAIGLRPNWVQPVSGVRLDWAAVACAGVQHRIRPYNETDAGFWTVIILGLSVFILRFLLKNTPNKQTIMRCYVTFRMSFLVHVVSMATEVVCATLAIGTSGDGSAVVFCLYFVVTFGLVLSNPKRTPSSHQGAVELFVCTTPVVWGACLVLSCPRQVTLLLVGYAFFGYGCYWAPAYDCLPESQKRDTKYSVFWHQFVPHVIGVSVACLEGGASHNLAIPVYDTVWFAVAVCQFVVTWPRATGSRF